MTQNVSKTISFPCTVEITYGTDSIMSLATQSVITV